MAHQYVLEGGSVHWQWVDWELCQIHTMARFSNIQGRWHNISEEALPEPARAAAEDPVTPARWEEGKKSMIRMRNDG